MHTTEATELQAIRQLVDPTDRYKFMSLRVLVKELVEEAARLRLEKTERSRAMKAERQHVNSDLKKRRAADLRAAGKCTTCGRSLDGNTDSEHVRCDRCRVADIRRKR